VNTGWDFAIVVISTISGLVVILDWLGIRPSEPVWGLLMPLSRNWKLGIMIGLMMVSFGFSARGYYRSLHPKIVEKIVEKPVDRIVDRVVEKHVPVPCPKPKAGINVQAGATVEGNANAPNSMAAGINTGTMMQGDVSPQFSRAIIRLNESKNGMFETAFTVQVTTNHPFVMQIVATGHYIADFRVMPPLAAGAINVNLQNSTISATRASGSLQNVTSGRYLITVVTNQPDNVDLDVSN